MSELINSCDSRATIRWKLLTSASALALTATISSVQVARAEDTGQPQIWIDLGGSIDLINGTGDIFTPPFTLLAPAPKAYMPVSPAAAQRASRYTFGPEGSISFQPKDSDWIFSAAIQYGRSSGRRDFEQQTPGIVYKNYAGNYAHAAVHNFLEAKTSNDESHLLIDFKAGKDVGIGVFGDGSSTISLGVRFAEFGARASSDIHARPNVHLYQPLASIGYPSKYLPQFHEYTLLANSKRSFRGIGPSLSWKASAPLAGNAHDGELSLDWDVNGALLFGRQRARVSHETTDRYFRFKYSYPTTLVGSHSTSYKTLYHNHPAVQNRMRNVTVPNLGASIGLSYRIEDFKLNFGYRADYFLGALDGGIDRAKKTTLSFNGLYASVSIGLGD